MEVGEAGADYVQFAATPEPDALELLHWWTEMMTVPSVIAGTFLPESASAFIGAGADFLAPAPAIWAAERPIEAIAALIP